MNKKILRSLRQNTTQNAFVLFIITAACFSLSFFGIASYGISRNAEQFQAEYRQEDAKFVTRFPFDVEAAAAQLGLLIEERGLVNVPLSQTVTLRVFSETQRVNIPYIAEGENLTAEGQILIDRDFAQSRALQIGDTLDILDKTFSIAGFIFLPDYLFPLNHITDLSVNSEAFGIGVISCADFAQLASGSTFYSAKLSADQALLLSAYIERSGNEILSWTERSENPRIAFADDKIAMLTHLANSLPYIILAMACFFTMVMMSRLLEAEAQEIKTLFLLGYTKNEVINAYLLYPFVLAVLAGILGTGLGLLLFAPFLFSLLDLLNLPHLSTPLPAYIPLLSVAVPIAVILPFSRLAIHWTLIRLSKGFTALEQAHSKKLPWES